MSYIELFSLLDYLKEYFLLIKSQHNFKSKKVNKNKIDLEIDKNKINNDSDNDNINNINNQSNENDSSELSENIKNIIFPKDFISNKNSLFYKSKNFEDYLLKLFHKEDIDKDSINMNNQNNNFICMGNRTNKSLNEKFLTKDEFKYKQKNLENNTYANLINNEKIKYKTLMKFSLISSFINNLIYMNNNNNHNYNNTDICSNSSNVDLSICNKYIEYCIELNKKINEINDNYSNEIKQILIENEFLFEFEIKFINKIYTNKNNNSLKSDDFEWRKIIKYEINLINNKYLKEINILKSKFFDEFKNDKLNLNKIFLNFIRNSIFKSNEYEINDNKLRIFELLMDNFNKDYYQRYLLMIEEKKIIGLYSLFKSQEDNII